MKQQLTGYRDLLRGWRRWHKLVRRAGVLRYLYDLQRTTYYRLLGRWHVFWQRRPPEDKRLFRHSFFGFFWGIAAVSATIVLPWLFRSESTVLWWTWAVLVATALILQLRREAGENGVINACCLGTICTWSYYRFGLDVGTKMVGAAAAIAIVAILVRATHRPDSS